LRHAAAKHNYVWLQQVDQVAEPHGQQIRCRFQDLAGQRIARVKRFCNIFRR